MKPTRNVHLSGDVEDRPDGICFISELGRHRPFIAKHCRSTQTKKKAYHSHDEFCKMELYFQEHEVNPNGRPTTRRTRPFPSQNALSNHLNALLLSDLNPTTTETERENETEAESAHRTLLANLAINNMQQQIQIPDPNGPPPASEEEIRNLPHIQLSSLKSSSSSSTTNINMTCPVCTDDFENNDDITSLPCRHHFHRKCVVAWLSRHCSCPVCRKEMRTDDEHYENTRRVERRVQAASQMRHFMFT